MRRYIKACFDLFLPRLCLVCGRRLLTEEEHLCLHCHAALPLTRYWERSHNPMADKFNELIQKRLEDGGPRETYSFACALFFYDSEGKYRKIPHSIKYQGNVSSGSWFGTMLGNMLSHSRFFSDIDMIIPVPLHWTRKWKRGYNQAEIIAKAVAEETGVSMRTDILVRTRRTATQTRLGIEEKHLNVSDAFNISETYRRDISVSKGTCATDSGQLHSTHNHPMHILLIDDIFTTGATLLACFTALRTVFPPSVRISVATLGFVGE